MDRRAPGASLVAGCRSLALDDGAHAGDASLKRSNERG